MDRNTFDLSHLSHTAGHIGRIQTLSVIPVEAGSSLDINLDGLARLAPCRKEIVSECQVDICAFFVPHRIVYGQPFIDMLKEGADSVPSFTGIPVAAAYRNASYLTLSSIGANINRALLEGYNRIYYNYYAVPSFSANPDEPGGATNNFTFFPTTQPGAANCRKYGRLAARLPHVLNGGNAVNVAVSGWETQGLSDVDAQVPVTAGTFDIRDLALVKSRFKSEAESAWFDHFYQDVMQTRWGTEVGPDTDPTNLRPHMLMRATHMMSGTDIDGMGDANMGTFQGKTLERISFNMPRKYFNEHGFVFVLGLFRYPLVHAREAHPLLQVTNYTYDQIAADPERYAAIKPEQFDPTPWLVGGSTFTPTANVLQPYGQHYRFQPNRVHENFAPSVIPGYPFSNFNGPLLDNWYYYADEEYRETFQTNQIGQWQLQARLKVMKQSVLPNVNASIFAGAN